MTDTSTTITRQLIAEDQRLAITAELFGINFPLRLEPFVYGITDRIAEGYSGGYWHFHTLSNGGFYMAPAADTPFRVCCENGFEGELTADALGITACLYACSHLSFGGDAFAEVMANHYHLLREYVFDHSECNLIFRAID